MTSHRKEPFWLWNIFLLLVTIHLLIFVSNTARAHPVKVFIASVSEGELLFRAFKGIQKIIYIVQLTHVFRYDLTQRLSSYFLKCINHVVGCKVANHKFHLQKFTKTMAFNRAKYKCIFRSDRLKQTRSWHLCERCAVHRPETCWSTVLAGLWVYLRT